MIRASDAQAAAAKTDYAALMSDEKKLDTLAAEPDLDQKLATQLYGSYDKVLVDLSRVLRASLRDVDLLGRIGGEEFLVIAPETNHEGAVVLAERIRSNVEGNAFLYKEDVIPVTVSVALVTFIDA